MTDMLASCARYGAVRLGTASVMMTRLRPRLRSRAAAMRGIPACRDVLDFLSAWRRTCVQIFHDVGGGFSARRRLLQATSRKVARFLPVFDSLISPRFRVILTVCRDIVRIGYSFEPDTGWIWFW